MSCSEMVPIKPRERQSLSDFPLLLEESNVNNSEFEFCIGNSFEHQQSSSADELFFNGVILPTQNQERFLNSSKRIHQIQNNHVPLLSSSSLPPLPPAARTENSKKGTIEMNSESEKQSKSKSFWGFGRSNSVNYECRDRKSSFCAIPLLLRSNSTGSSSLPNSKRTPLQEGKRQKPEIQRQKSVSEGKSKFSFSSSLFSKLASSNPYSKLQRTQFRKTHLGGIHGVGSKVYITPILNIPPPYIIKETSNIFGLNSLLRSGKEKKSSK